MRKAFLFAPLALLACAASPVTFPLRAPFERDTDLDPVDVACRTEPTKKDPNHVSCAPEEYVSPLAWDGADNMVFRPIAKFFQVDPPHEAVNANALDEVPDSAWFTNRLGAHEMTAEEIARGACEPKMMLDTDHAEDGSWVIDQGKSNGSSKGFRVKVKGKGKYLLKADIPEQPERPSASSVIGAAVYNAAGYFTSCEQIVFVKPSSLKLTPGLTYKDNSDVERPFDEKAMKAVIDSATKRGDRIRFQASAWLPGKLIGPFKYEGTRCDDPNDVIPHENRRELRGARVLASWVDHFDSREQNSMDSWISGDEEHPDASPGFVRHYYLDTSDALGSEWEWDAITRRLGVSYFFDGEDVLVDTLTLGLLPRTWDRRKRTPGFEQFGYYNVKDFTPDTWKNEYQNPAFLRATERDNAWMARILAHVSLDAIEALAHAGQFSEPDQTRFLVGTMEGRLEKILARYLTVLSPLADVKGEGDAICATDLAMMRDVRPPSAFHFAAKVVRPSEQALAVEAKQGARVCVKPPRGAPGSYVVVRIADGVAKGSLDVHAYDLGPKGFEVVGLVRTAP